MIGAGELVCQCIRLPDGKTIRCLCARRKGQKKDGEAEDDMAKHLQRRPGRDGC